MTVDPIEWSDKLKREANALLYDAGFLALLEKYGQVELVGSYASNLMTWRDINLQFLLEDAEDKATVFAMAKEIGVNFDVKRVVFNHHRLQEETPFNYGLYLGIHLLLRQKTWKIDIWCVGPKDFERTVAEHRAQIKALKSIDRHTILTLKFALIERGDYRNTIWSVDLYRAILEGNILTIEQFDEWRRDQFSRGL
jgi:hypothetical protein